MGDKAILERVAMLISRYRVTEGDPSVEPDGNILRIRIGAGTTMIELFK